MIENDKLNAMQKNKLSKTKILRRILMIMMLVWLAVIVILIGMIHRTGILDNAETSDVIVVLGAGLARDGRPGYALTRRSAHAADLWHEGYADSIICTGGIAENQTRSEADGCHDVLLRRGVPESAIFLEEVSASTEENAIYSREILLENNFDSVILVSDSYHLFRARYIFETEDFRNISLSPVSANLIRGYPTYESSVIREVLALHWQVFKTIFNIPLTNL